jgi:predicted Zn-dependent peptidase
MKTRARVLDFISSYLSDGRSSKLYKKVVDEKKIALQIGAVGFSQEDYGMYITAYRWKRILLDLLNEIDEEIVKIQTDLISERLSKLQNQFENQYVDNNSNVEELLRNLAKYYLLYGDINLINTEINLYHSISRED